ncbi:probable aminoacyl tRNA synthase complex-interacting multifunctional protein 2 isoform X2 [Zootermopsis nevadensis]|uniref:probable aminoacyl tRNA synthase complex-interacting multifunctional protein 2 isoform X2 n=1 Tax=Zootermopsis nevadensis TaxID=136037 RepID=UPI000B8EE827|nr:probable aminoacyl tRNA synthase complex-interacting multifunctional protein 2 isoform X2 [Zootermopsis nevadensis]
MNGPNTMYRMRPIIKLTEELELPKCMYRMKNIQQAYLNNRLEHQLSNETRPTSISEQCPLPEMTALENRQEAILAQLADLKNQITALRGQLKQSAAPPAVKETNISRSRTCNILQNGVIHDIVINASPKYPPYSLVALRRLWGDSLKLGVRCHIHSSVLQLPTNLENFLSVISDDCDQERSSLLNITLVWKDVGPDTELVVSPMKHITIKGEVNILRYLSRLGPPRYNYELSNDPAVSSRLDSLLDTCYSLARCRTVKERQSLIHSLNCCLGKSQFMAGGDGISIADIAVWSVFRQIKVEPLQDLSGAMKNWLQHCSQSLKLDS